MEKSDWLDKCAAKYRKNGLFSPGDGMISKSESIDWAQQLLSQSPDFLDEDPEKVADSQDISSIFGEDKD